MDPVEEKCQARRAEEQAQQDLPNITLAPVLNRGRRRGRWMLRNHSEVIILKLVDSPGS